MQGHVAMGIPVVGRARIDQFNEPHTTFSESSGHQTLPGKPPGAASFQTIQRMGRIGFARQIEELGQLHLHAEGRLKGLHPSRQEGIGRTGRPMPEVHAVHGRHLQGLKFFGRGPPAHIGHRFLTRHHPGALMRPRQEITGPDLPPGIRALGCNHHEGRQVAVLGAQAIADPGSDAGAGEGERSGVDAQGGLVMIGVVGGHRPDHAQVIHTPGHVGKETAHFGAAPAMSGEIPLRPLGKHGEVALAPLELINGHRLARIGEQPRLGIPRIDMGNPAAHVQEDHPLGLGGKMRRAGNQRIGGRAPESAFSGEEVPDNAREHQGAAHHGSQKAATAGIKGCVRVHGKTGGGEASG